MNNMAKVSPFTVTPPSLLSLHNTLGSIAWQSNADGTSLAISPVQSSEGQHHLKLKGHPMKIVHCFRSLLILGLFLTTLTGCAGGEGGDPSISTSATPIGATASLAWDPVQDHTVYAYYVHYGKQSSGQPGSCNYEDSQYNLLPFRDDHRAGTEHSILFFGELL